MAEQGYDDHTLQLSCGGTKEMREDCIDIRQALGECQGTKGGPCSRVHEGKETRPLCTL
jgi:hypothetical protein